MQRYVHSQLVLSVSDSSYGNMTLQTGCTFECGSSGGIAYVLRHQMYAIPAGMYASQVWATPFLRQGKDLDNPLQKWLMTVLKRILMVKDNSFWVCHARMWSRASTVQLVPGGSAAIQCFNPKQQLHFEKDRTC